MKTTKSRPTREQNLRRVLRGLRKIYGPRIWRREGSALDILVEAMLAQNTNIANAQRGYRMLRRRFSSWTKVMNAPVHEVEREIAICGLARMRAKRLQQLLRTVKDERGKLDLNWLGSQPPRAAYDYLLSFFGVGPKTAAFTLLFAFNHPILPIDNGILRVARRLRLVRSKARDVEAERVLSPAIAKGAHYESHLLLFTHAKQRCRPRNPKCDECALVQLCPYGQRRLRHQPKTIDMEALPPPRVRRVILSRMISSGLAKHAPDEAPPDDASVVQCISK